MQRHWSPKPFTNILLHVCVAPSVRYCYGPLDFAAVHVLICENLAGWLAGLPLLTSVDEETCQYLKQNPQLC